MNASIPTQSPIVIKKRTYIIILLSLVQNLKTFQHNFDIHDLIRGEPIQNIFLFPVKNHNMLMRDQQCILVPIIFKHIRGLKMVALERTTINMTQMPEEPRIVRVVLFEIPSLSIEHLFSL
jgi:hypothetical protein